MRTGESDLFTRRLLGLLGKAEWEEELHPRDPAGKFAPSSEAATAEGVVAERERSWTRYKNRSVVDSLDPNFRTASSYFGREETEQDLKDVEFLKETLSSLPKSHLEHGSRRVKEVVAFRNPSDAKKAYAKEYGKKSRFNIEGFYSPDTAVLGAITKPISILHEFGHALLESPKFRLHRAEWEKLWESEVKTGKERITGYAKVDAGEGYAEAYAMFSNTRTSNAQLKEEAPKVHAFMERVFKSGLGE